jgi:succinate dehydrogenase / fumarate reductase, membrane anchor subunit
MHMVGSVTNLSKNGLSDWLIQRVSAIVIVAYLAVTLYFVCCHSFSFASWSSLQHNFLMRAFSALFLLSLLAHAWVGIWTVLTDYAKPACVRLALQVALFLFLFGCLVWGLCLIF